MITNFQIPYSWFNITSKNNNNTFKFYWPTATNTYNTFTIIIQNGFYTTTTLNLFIQQFCVTNGMYLIEAVTDKYHYFINMLYNETYYANQVVLKTVPTSLPTGYSAPSNWAGYPTVSRTPYVEILNNNFGKFLGFTIGNYGINSVTNFSINSNITPLGSTVNSLIVRCSLVSNNISSQTDIIDSFAISGTFGSNLNYTNNIEKWSKLNSGRYSSFTITIVDQNFNDVDILDSNLLINLLIRTKK